MSSFRPTHTNHSRKRSIASGETEVKSLAVPTILSSATCCRTGVLPPPFVLDPNGRKLFRSVCRGRGVAKDHTAENAYLLIPEDASHGYILSCSHEGCRKSGRQFRYCVVCRQPVTKRNFHKRHDHGLIKYNDGKPVLPWEESTPPVGRRIAESQPDFVGSVVTGTANDMCPSKEDDAPIILKHGSGDAARLQHRTASTEIVSEDDEGSADGGDHGGQSFLPLSHEEQDILKRYRDLCNKSERVVNPLSLRKVVSVKSQSSLRTHPRTVPPPKRIKTLVQADDDIEDLDAVLGDFDQDLDGYEGEWELSSRG